jgi:hypothetical protein
MISLQGSSQHWDSCLCLGKLFVESVGLTEITDMFCVSGSTHFCLL